MPRLKFIALFAVILFVFCCAPSKKVVRKGVLMTEDEAARLDYNDIKKSWGLKKKKDSLLMLQKFVKDYPDNRLSTFALFKIAEIYSKTDTEKATSALEELIFRFPLSDLANDAKFALGKLYLSKDKPDEAKLVLSSIKLDSYPNEKKLQILGYLKKSLELTESWVDLVYCDIKIYDLSTDFSYISALKREILELIESRLKPRDLYELAKNRGTLYPADQAVWKLTKIAYHMGELKNARNYVSHFLKNFPMSEYIKEAEHLYDRITQRKSPDSRRIGVLLPLSGPNSAVGEIALEGIWMASRLFETTRGPYDRISISVKDTMGDPDSAARAFEDLVIDKRVFGIIGPMLSKTSEIIALKAQEYGVPVILLNQSENLTLLGDFVFRNFLTKSEQAKTLAKFSVESLGIKKFAMLYPEHSYGTTFIEAFWDELENHPDVSVKAVQSYDPGTDDFSKPIKALVGLNDLKYRKDELCKDDIQQTEGTVPLDGSEVKCYEAKDIPPVIDFDAIVIPDNYEKIIQVAPSLAYYDVKALQLIGGNLWDTDSIFKEGTGRYLQGAIFTDAFFKHSSNPAIKSFNAKFQTLFGKEPEIIASQAYETASVMFQAIENSSATSSSELKNVLASKKDFQTLSGTTYFSENRNLYHDLSILVIDGNEIKELY